MIPKIDFTITINFRIETDKDGLKKLSFNNPFHRSFYLPPYEWEMGLVKAFIPHRRMIPMKKLRFEMKHRFPLNEGQGNSRYLFNFRAQNTLSYSHYINDINDYVKDTINSHETNRDWSFKLGIDSGKLVFSNFRWPNYDHIEQESQLRFYDSESLRKLGFLNITQDNIYYDTPFTAISEPILSELSTTLLLSAPNLIEYQLIGNTYKTVLELIPYDYSKQNTDVEFNFPTISYKRLIGGYINDIDLELEDLDKQARIAYPFLSSFQFVLHFRPCQSSIKMQ